MMLILIGLIVVPVTFADGMAYKGRDISSWRAAQEDEQRAFIECRDGRQKMIVSIALPMEEDESAVWILPVPGEPRDIQVDLQDEFPRISGSDPLKQARETVSGLFGLSLVTQIYPILPMSCLLPSLNRDRASAGVLAEVDKYGLRTQVIDVKSLDALVDHLKSEAVAIDRSSVESFQPYFQSPHGFVVTWVKSWKQVRKEFPDLKPGFLDRQPAVAVNFPSSQPWFPMRATSGYGAAEVGLRLYISGFVRLKTAAKLGKPIDHRYYVAGSHPTEKTRTDYSYTFVNASLRGSDLTDDFHFESYEPPGIKTALAIDRASRFPWVIWTVVIGYILIISLMCGAIASRLMIGRWKIGAKFGLFNLFTVLAVYLAVRDWKSEDAKRLHAARLGGTRFWMVFSLLFVGVTVLLRFITLAALFPPVDGLL